MHRRSMRGKANKLRPRQGSRRRDVNATWMLLWLRYRFSIFRLSLCFVTHKTSTKVVPGCNREIHSHQQATICRYKLNKTVFDTWMHLVWCTFFRSRLEKIKSRQETHLQPLVSHFSPFQVPWQEMLGHLQDDSQTELAKQLQDKVPWSHASQTFIAMKFRNSWQAAQKQFITKLIVQGLLMLLEACLGGWYLRAGNLLFYSYSMLCQDSVEVRCRKCDEAQAGKSLHRFSWKLQTRALISIDQALVSDCIGDAVKEYTQAQPCDKAGGDALESKNRRKWSDVKGLGIARSGFSWFIWSQLQFNL